MSFIPSRVGSKLFAWFVWAFYRLWFATWRMQIIDSESVRKHKAEGTPWVMAMWHGDELAIVAFCSNYKSATLTSTSKDGELMNNVLLRLGMKTSRGSSTRGGASALKGLIRLTRDGYSPVVPVDGPKGPYHKAKPGVFEIAKVCRLPIIAAGVYCSQKIVFKKSWNKAFLPLPFAKVCLLWGEDFYVPPNTDSRDPSLAQQLEKQLDAVSRTGLKLFAKS